MKVFRVFLRKVWEDAKVFLCIILGIALFLLFGFTMYFVMGYLTEWLEVRNFDGYILIGFSIVVVYVCFSYLQDRWRESQSEVDDSPEWREGRLDGREDG